MIERDSKIVNKSTILFNGKLRVLDTVEVYKMFGVDEIIRVPNNEYPATLKSYDIVNHFNLRLKSDQKDYFAMLAKIIKNGYFKQNGEMLMPVLNLKDIWKAKIIDTKYFSDYTKVPNIYFSNTIGNIKTIKDLRQTLIYRYSSVLPDVSIKDILSEGVTVRTLRLIDIHSFKP